MSRPITWDRLKTPAQVIGGIVLALLLLGFLISSCTTSANAKRDSQVHDFNQRCDIVRGTVVGTAKSERIFCYVDEKMKFGEYLYRADGDGIRTIK